METQTNKKARTEVRGISFYFMITAYWIAQGRQYGREGHDSEGRGDTTHFMRGCVFNTTTEDTESRDNKTDY